MARTQAWAMRCLTEHRRLRAADRGGQALFAVVQGAQYEDLRRKAARDLARTTADGAGFDGYGIGGALQKQNLGAITGWVCAELAETKPRHMLGISEPDDFFTAVDNGADTFDCVSPSRLPATPPSTPATAGSTSTRRPVGERSPRSRRSATATPAAATRAPTAPPVQSQGDARRHAVHHPQRAVRRPSVDDIRAAIEQGDFDDLRAESSVAITPARRTTAPDPPRAPQRLGGSGTEDLIRPA